MYGVRAWFLFYWKYVAPLCLAILPLMPVVCALDPWPAADLLVLKYAAEKPVAVGVSDSFFSSQSEGQRNWTTTHRKSRSYLLMSALLPIPMVLTVKQVDASPPTVSEERISADTLIEIAIAYLVGGFSTWWFWFRPLFAKGTSPWRRSRIERLG